jgi:L-aminopeptidase/D-esterase-like protein
MALKPGPRNLITDVPGIEVGNAVDSGIHTGVTVIKPRERSVCAIDARGGAVGAVQSELIGPGTAFDGLDALVFSGGSLYGLGASAGVTAALAGKGIGLGLRGTLVPVVPGAIIFDLLGQKRADWYGAPPYERLGREAVAALAADFALGSVGAGTAASACSYAGGLGSASVQTDDGLIVGALAVVNSLGEVAVPGKRAFWAWPFEMDAEFGGYGPPDGAAPLHPDLSLPPALRDPGMSTTLVAVATNARLTQSQATRVSVMAQAGLARAIRPVHTLFDGDIVYTIATGEVEAANPLRQMLIGNLAADCVARAIARAVYHAGPHQTLPGWKTVHE